jgi:hypothetical protein
MIGSVGGASGGYDAASIQQMRTQVAERMLKAVDANQDGKITEDELSKAIQAQGNKKGPSAAEIIKQLDQGNKGYLTEQDLEAGLAKADQAKQSQGPPRGGAGKAGGGEAPSAGGGTSAATSYDPADLNQDGVVTMQERVQYALQQYAAQKEAQPSNQLSIYA